MAGKFALHRLLLLTCQRQFGKPGDFFYIDPFFAALLRLLSLFPEALPQPQHFQLLFADVIRRQRHGTGGVFGLGESR